MTSLQSIVLDIAMDSAREDRQALRRRRKGLRFLQARGPGQARGPRNLQGPSCNGATGGTRPFHPVAAPILL